MDRILVFLTVVVYLLTTQIEAAYSASFGDIFGRKKEQEASSPAAGASPSKEQECQAKLAEAEARYQQSVQESKEAQDTVAALREKNSSMMEAYETAKTGENDILEQLKRLRRENEGCVTLKGSYDKLSEQNKSSLELVASLNKERDILTLNMESFKLHIKELTEEKDRLTLALEEAQATEDVKIKNMRDKVKDEVADLNAKVVLLSNENNVLKKNLEESEKYARKIESDNVGFRKELELLKNEFVSLEKKHAETKDENRHLADEVSEFPKRFSDLARHNQKLVKETAAMHYNLGVSHIKGKEYERAIKEFEKVLELRPDDSAANYNLGYIFAEHVVDRPLAIKYFKTYLAQAPDAHDADWVRKYILTWQSWYGKEKLK